MGSPYWNLLSVEVTRMDETHSTVTGQRVSCPLSHPALPPSTSAYIYIYSISFRASIFSSTSTSTSIYRSPEPHLFLCFTFILTNNCLFSDQHAGAVFGSVPHIVQVDDYNEQLSFKVSTARTGVALSVKFAEVVKCCSGHR